MQFEFEFLTGDSIAFLPSNCSAYQFYIKPGTYSLVSTLKEQGYRTVAIILTRVKTGTAIRVIRTWDSMILLTRPAMRNGIFFRNYVSDQSDYENLIRQVENKENPDDRLFLFNVTMQNHGGYEGSTTTFRRRYG